MTRCIVCGVDESSGSRRVASVAARLARDLDSRALLVHVSQAGGLLYRLRPAQVRRTRETRKRLKAIADEHCFPERTHVGLEAGDPADKLMAVAEQEDAELVVIASRGTSKAGAALLGSVSSTLMGMAPCPVVVVPPGTVAPVDSASMRSVVCGVAGEETDLALLRLAADLADRLGGCLHAVHASPSWAQLAGMGAAPARPPDDDLRRSAERRLTLALEEAGVAARETVLPLPAPDALERIAEEKRAGLIVVGSRGRGKLGSTLQGSVPTRLAGEGRTAVVVLPPRARLEAGSGHYEMAADAA
jgi:nucleotide-binding universal stress UspA family protein